VTGRLPGMIPGHESGSGRIQISFSMQIDDHPPLAAGSLNL